MAIANLTPPPLPIPTGAPWLDLMQSMNGLKEIAGKKNNPKIVEFAHVCGHPEVNDDETAWCAFSLGYCLKTAGYPIPPTNINGMARSYLQYGTALAGPKVGAIVVFPRGNSKALGHVAIVTKVEGDQITCIGGNQNNAISEAIFNAKNALGFRWPPQPATIIGTTKTLATSKRFMTSITGALSLVVGGLMNGFDHLFNGIGWLVDQAPGMKGEAQGLIDTNQQVFEWMGIPWGKVSIAVAAICLIIVAVRHAVMTTSDKNEGYVTDPGDATIPTINGGGP